MEAMGAQLWQHWLAFFAAEPQGGYHEELRWGILVSTLRRGLFADCRDTPADVFPALRHSEPEPPTLAAQAGRMEAWARAALARQRRGGSMAAE